MDDMDARDDVQLLREYADTGSPRAFACLVERHAGMVFSAARRQVKDWHLAEDVTQQVFMRLARLARSLRQESVPAAWLLVTTRFVAADARKAAARRAAREQKAAEMNSPTPPGAPGHTRWAELEPLLDEALCSLGTEDRRAVTLRFFQGLSFDEVGERLGLTAVAARQRVHRAVGRLQTYFSRHGIAIEKASFASLVAAHAAGSLAPPPPPGLVSTILKASAPLHGTAAHMAGGALAKGAIMATLSKAKILTAAALAAALMAVGATTVAIHAAHKNEQIVPLTSARNAVSQPVDVAIDPSWKSRFDPVYSLGDEQAVKCIPGPFIPERRAYTSSQKLFGPIPDACLVLQWDGNAVEQPWPWYGRMDLKSILRAVAGIRAIDCVGLDQIKTPTLLADWIVRTKASPAERLAAIESSLGSQFGLRVHFALRNVDRDVIVATGKPNLPKERGKVIALFVDRATGSQPVFGGDLDDLLGDVGELIGMKVVSEASKDPAHLIWAKFIPEAEIPAIASKRDKLLANLSKQINVQFHVERRTIPVWFVEQSAPAPR